MEKFSFIFTNIGIKSGLILKRWGLYLVILCGIGYFFRHAINPDGIAYLQIAHNWLGFRPELAISGYWGPFISFLLMPLLGLGLSDLLAARIIMGFSAIFFLHASSKVLAQSTIQEIPRRILISTLAATSLLWSVENISPDLLLAGIYLRIVALILQDKWGYHKSHSIQLGCWFGLAYLSKSVALPVSIGFFTYILIIKWTWFRHKMPRLQPVLLVLMVWGMLAGMWIAILSFHYEKLTFSTSARIVHATVGPSDIQRYPLGFDIGPPEEGRITTWEDPELREEQYWNPFESSGLLKHQVSVIIKNVIPAIIVLSTVFLFIVPALALVAGQWRLSKHKQMHSPKFWRGMVVLGFIGMTTCIYLPTLLPITEQRYFYALAPLGVLLTIELTPYQWFADKKHWIISFAIAGLMIPTIARWIVLPSVKISAFQQAKWVSDHILDDPDSTPGPIVGNARLRRGRAGLFLAYFLDQPWYGGNPTAPLDELISSGAHYVALAYDDPRIQLAESQGGLIPLGSNEDHWLKVYRIKEIVSSQ